MLRKIIASCLLCYVLIPSVIFAHPGNTDSSGGHTCRTNCEDWGLNYGEYHFHNSWNFYDPQAEYDAGYEEGYSQVYDYTSECNQDYEWEWEGTKDYGDGFENGVEDAHWDGLEVCYEKSYEAGADNGESDSYEGLDYDEERDYFNTYDFNSYVQGYEEGYDEEVYAEATGDEVSTVSTDPVVSDVSREPSSDITEEEGEDFTIGFIGFGAVILILVLSVAHDKFRFRKEND